MDDPRPADGTAAAALADRIDRLTGAVDFDGALADVRTAAKAFAGFAIDVLTDEPRYLGPEGVR